MAQRNAELVNGNPLKLAIFGPNCSSGRTYTTLPERWVASWENNLALARLTDQVGIEGLIPIPTAPALSRSPGPAACSPRPSASTCSARSTSRSTIRWSPPNSSPRPTTSARAAWAST